MTKASETLTLLALAAVAWLLMMFNVIPTSETVRESIVPALPLWAIVAFGSYALSTLGYDVLTFNDKPEKYKELMAQIKEAKSDLTAKGVL